MTYYIFFVDFYKTFVCEFIVVKKYTFYLENFDEKNLRNFYSLTKEFQ